MKTILIKYLYITILSIFLTNSAYAENERAPFESMQEYQATVPTLSTASSREQSTLFRSQSTGGMQRAAGDRPGNGDGIGQVPVDDAWWIVLIMLIGYCLEIGYCRYYKQKAGSKNKEAITD